MPAGDYATLCPDPAHPRPLPEAVLEDGRRRLERLEQAAAPEDMAVFAARGELLNVLALSEFIAAVMTQYPRECAQLLRAGALDDPQFGADPAPAVCAELDPSLAEREFMHRLRRLRRTRMVIIAWRDLTGRCDIGEVFAALTALAEQLVLRAVEAARIALQRALGEACDEQGRALPLMVLGMGKLGGGELNFSSDIDLILVYPHDGQTAGGMRSVSHQEYFTRVTQRVVRLLAEPSADGIGYRIDLRLRPFGDAGPLVSSFESLSIYYETQGRTWERYALVKARILGGEEACAPYGAELMELLRPFVYRRYLDFGAIESLRKLKAMIEAELRRRRLAGNFKLGRGGIREIEFIAQVFALMRGGRQSELAERSLRRALAALGRLGLLPEEECEALERCYLFLRRMENAVQEFADSQTQTLPGDERGQQRLAWVMNQESYAALQERLQQVTDYVHSRFSSIIHDGGEDGGGSEETEGALLWDARLEGEEMSEALRPLLSDPSQAGELAAQLTALHTALAHQPVGPVGRETLARLMPHLIALVCAREGAVQLFRGLARLLERIATRTTYLQLLQENRLARQRLIRILAENAFASDLICAHPILLDELIAPQYFTSPPARAEYEAWLREQLLRVEPGDLEEQMEMLRLFRQTMTLRIAMSDQAGTLPLMQVSDCLTFLAEALLATVTGLAWDYAAGKFGCPPDTSRSDPGMAVIAYGKLGGLELGYKSDLDMVVIRSPGESSTSGPACVSSPVFYQRLVQRMMHLCITRMAGGVLYDMDMRLRPDGDSGLLVTDSAAFDDYQSRRAWTWEHQALVRSRAIYGSPQVIRDFEATRARILRRPRDPVQLRTEVAEMRERMRAHHDHSDEGHFDLKQGRGAMIDIEFIAQYLMLREAPRCPEMVLWTDDVRIFEECGRLGILSDEDCRTLCEAYLEVRGLHHRRSLADLPRVVPLALRPEACCGAAVIWERLLGGAGGGG